MFIIFCISVSWEGPDCLKICFRGKVTLPNVTDAQFQVARYFYMKNHMSNADKELRKERIYCGSTKKKLLYLEILVVFFQSLSIYNAQLDYIGNMYISDIFATGSFYKRTTILFFQRVLPVFKF